MCDYKYFYIAVPLVMNCKNNAEDACFHKKARRVPASFFN